MKCTRCGYVTSYERLHCPRCRGEMVRIEVSQGKVLFSWKLNVTPEGNEEEYYLNVVEAGQGKVLCKSFEKFDEGEEVLIEQQVCKKKG